MTEMEAQDLLDRATRIGLINKSQAMEAMGDAKDGSLAAIERSLSRKGFLTGWQIDKLRKGEAGGFFYRGSKVLFHLAEGTFARVYRGVREIDQSPVAIKVLRQRFATDPEAIDRFFKEAEAGLKLDHPNIVKIHEYGEDGGRYFMIMEYVEGANLRDFLKRRKYLTYREALPMMIGLAKGLKHSLDQGITHRDIKGTNILISSGGMAKLVDFGLATINEGDEKKMAAAHGQRTVDYSALERVSHSPKGDPRSDIFFLGCVFYQMLTGQAPMSEVESDDPLKKMLKRSFGAIKPLSEQRHAPPEELAAIIERMMKVDLKLRYQTIDEVIVDLEAFREKLAERDAAGGGAVVETIDDSDSDDDVPIDFDSLRVEDIFVRGGAIPSVEPAKAGPGAEGERGAVPTGESRPIALDDEFGDPAGSNGHDPDDDHDLVIGHAEADDNGDPHERGGEFRALVQRKIFCVESQEAIREAFDRAFEKQGYRVFVFGDPEIALERFAALVPEILLFDADGLGHDAIKHLRAMLDLPRDPASPLRSLVLLGPKQVGWKASLDNEPNLIALVKPVKLRDILQAMERIEASAQP